jgi:hypothetical protein
MRISIFLVEVKRGENLVRARIFDINMYRGVTIDELVNGFIDHLYISLGATSNYSAIADLHKSPQQPLSFSQPLCLHQPFPDNGF